MRLFLFLFVFSTNIFAQLFSIEGTVIDLSNKNVLSYANIYIKELKIGTISDSLGKFTFNNLSKGIYTLQFSYIGYKPGTITLNLTQNIDTVIYLTEEPFQLEQTLVSGISPKFRKTPVAFNEINSINFEKTIGNRETINIIETTPSSYISDQGGGIGEQRLSLRGFDQTNIAVMLNGVPLNNPENGEIYWSNWTGISDIVEKVIVQRGFSAIPYSTSSIGGVVNILTFIPHTNEEKISFLTSFGSDNFIKNSLSIATNIFKNFRLKGFISKSTSDGYADQVYSDVYTYYIGADLLLKNHNLQIQFLDSPQKHGQRLTQLSIKDWQKYGKTFNADWGYLNGKSLNLRDNFFQNPTLNINYSWQISDSLSWNNILSFSRGSGGGTVPPFYPELSRTKSGLIDFNKEWQINTNNIDENYDPIRKRSIIALRKGIHKNYWATIISSVNYNLNHFSFTLGIDGKYYNAENYNELSNLLGGDYYIGSSNVNLPNETKLFKGDKVDFYADSFTRKLGGFLQTEYSRNKVSAYINFAYSKTMYNRIDYFNYLNTDPKRKTGWQEFNNYTIKTGINYNFNNLHNIFINFGNFSKAPISENVFDYSNNKYENLKNEKIISFELGYGFKSVQTKINVNYYNTFWKDKAFGQTFLSKDSTSLYYINIFGAAANHTGIEVEGVHNIFDKLKFNGMFSYSINKWNNDINAFIRPEANPANEIKFHSYTKDLYVGNFPMTSAAVSVQYSNQFSKNVNYFIEPIYNYYGRYYAKFSPNSRTLESNKNIQPWRIPDYFNLDLHMGLEFNLENTFIKKAKLFFHLFNVINKEYIIDATDGSNNNKETALVWYGRGRWWNLNLSIIL